jgi:hypothetical protein
MRALGPALRLGARVGWQNRMVVDDLLTGETTLVVSRATLARPQQGNVRWVAVVPGEHTTNPVWPHASEALMPFPMGSSDNRFTRTRAAAARFARLWSDHTRALALMHGVARPLPGSYFARIDGPTIRVDAFR